MSQTKRWKLIVAGSAAALVLGAGALWGSGQTNVVHAQANEPAVAIQADQSEITPVQFGRGFGRGFDLNGRGIRFGEDLLANALGITEAELEAARQAAHDAAIEQAVADGLLTQEQADQLLDGYGRGYARLLDDVDHDALLAEALSITVEELEAAKDNMIDAAVEAGLLTEAQGNDMTVRKMVREAMGAAAEEAMQEAVDGGLITQAQVDNLLDRRDGIMRGFGREGHGTRFGSRGGHGFHQRFDPGFGQGYNQDFDGGNRNRGPRFDNSQFETPESEAPVVPTTNL